MKYKSFLRNQIFLIVLGMFFIIPTSYSQHLPGGDGTIPTGYAYAYDDAGNRISRVLTFKKRTKMEESANTTTEEELPPVTDFVGEREILIYPNPTRGHMKIEFKGDYDIENSAVTIYTMNGVLVYSGKMNQNPLPIDISEQANGAYILRIADGESFTSWRLVKE